MMAGIPRRSAIKGIGVTGAALMMGGLSCATKDPAKSVISTRMVTPHPDDWQEQILKQVAQSPLVDTHEHLPEEHERLGGTHSRTAANDWSVVMSHYLESDLAVAGMSDTDRAKFYGSETDPVAKWRLIEPYWPKVKHTGYGQTAVITIRQLYGVDDLNENTIPKVQEGYESLIKPGFYKRVLHDVAGIDSCQVNCLSRPFMESRMPDYLLQDLSFIGMHMGPDLNSYAVPAGIDVKTLDDWHRVIDWWFEQYGPYAVAVKSQAAYSRDVDFEDVPAEEAAPIFARVMNQEPVPLEGHLQLQGHLFWYCVRKAAEYQLPVKLHLGYYAGHNGMPFDRVTRNTGSISNVLRHAVQHVPDAHFVLMHIAYPNYEDLIAVAKHYTNCAIDMCWAWIVNPAASVQFLKHFLLAVPSNKVLTFGGDYIPVEPVVGHAAIARQGIAQTLCELVAEGWLTTDGALDLVAPLTHGNGQALFNIEAKKQACREAPWAT